MHVPLFIHGLDEQGLRSVSHDGPTKYASQSHSNALPLAEYLQKPFDEQFFKQLLKSIF